MAAPMQGYFPRDPSKGATLLDLAIDVVRDYNASGSSAAVSGGVGSITSGQKVLTVPTADLPTGTDAFKSGHGIWISGAGASGNPLITTISSISVSGSDTQFSLADAASTTVSGAYVYHCDTPAFQSLCNDASNATVIIPNGTYNLWASTTMPGLAPSGIRFVGQGGPTLDFKANGASGDYWGAVANCSFEGITFTAPGTYSGHAIFGNSSTSNESFINCTITDCTSIFHASGSGVMFDGCEFTQSSSPPSPIQQTIGASDDFRVKDCVFNFAPSGSSQTLIDLKYLSTGGKAWITGCRLLDGNDTGYYVDAGIDLEPQSGQNPAYVEVSGCVIFNCKVYVSNTDLVVVRNNYFRWTSVAETQPAMFIDQYNSGTNADGGMLLVAGNRMYQDDNASATGSPTITKTVAYFARVIWKDNDIQQNGSGAGGNPFWLTAGAEEFVLEGNRITQTAALDNDTFLNMAFTATSFVKKIRLVDNDIVGTWQHLISSPNNSSPAAIEELTVQGNNLQDFTAYTDSVFSDGNSNTYGTNDWNGNPGYNPIGTVTPTASPPVSGASYQNTSRSTVTVYVPCYATSSGTAGTVKVGVGSATGPGTLFTQQISGSSSSAEPDVVSIRVPAGWYWVFTTSGVTMAETLIQGE